MILKRKMYNKLLDLKNNLNGTKALLIEGARRIGKSTVVEQYAKNSVKTNTEAIFSLILRNVPMRSRITFRST